MNRIKNDTQKMERYKQTLNVLQSNVEYVKRISKLQTAMEQLDLNLKKLTGLYDLFDHINLNSKLSKDKLRAELLKVLLPIISIMQIFAYDKQKKNLTKRLELLTYEHLQNCSDVDLINISRRIWLTANKYGLYSIAFTRKNKFSIDSNKSKAINKLQKDYGLIPDMVKNIESINISFIDALLFYQSEIEEMENTRRKIKKLEDRIESLVNNYIDRFIVLFENENSDFYKEYLSTREFKQSSEEVEPETSTLVGHENIVTVEEKKSKRTVPKSRSKNHTRSRTVKKVDA